MSQGTYLRNDRSELKKPNSKAVLQSEKSTCIGHIWCVLICLVTTILGLVSGNQLM